MRLAIHELLSIGPLPHEFIRGIEVGRDRPFTKPQGKVPSRSGTLNPIEV